MSSQCHTQSFPLLSKQRFTKKEVDIRAVINERFTQKPFDLTAYKMHFDAPVSIQVSSCQCVFSSLCNCCSQHALMRPAAPLAATATDSDM